MAPMLFIFCLLTPMLVGYDMATKGLVSPLESFLCKICMATAVAVITGHVFP